MKNCGYNLNLLFFAYTLMFIAILPAPSFVRAQSTYWYGYLRVTNYGSVAELFVVDPMNPEAAPQQRSFSIPNGWILGSPVLPSALSPNGEWFATLLAPPSGGPGLIQITNLVSGDIRRVIEGHILSHGRSMAWSPDGDNLALNITQGNEDLDIFVYSLADGQLSNLTNDNFDQQDITWSSDSSQIMTFTRPCAADTACASQLQVFDVQRRGLVNSVDLSDIPLLGSAACNALLSPDRRYISFISNCGFGLAGMGDFPSEIHLWELQTGRLIQVTEFSAEAQSSQQLFRAFYNQTWLDNQMLLIGINYQISGGQIHHQLLAYDVADETQNVLSTAFAGYRINPLFQQLVVWNYALPDNTISLQGQTNLFGFAPLSTLTADSQALSQDIQRTTISIPAACDIQWSPDGTMLYATITASTEGCQGFVSGVTFINPATQAVQEYDFQSLNDVTDYIIPIGWIAR